jgi:hypothetical protein
MNIDADMGGDIEDNTNDNHNGEHNIKLDEQTIKEISD